MFLGYSIYPVNEITIVQILFQMLYSQHGYFSPHSSKQEPLENNTPYFRVPKTCLEI